MNHVQRLLLFSQRPQRKYIFQEYFNDTVAAGSVNATLATPGPGTRTANDTESKLSVAGGVFVCAGGKASPAWGAPHIRYVTHAIPRVTGRVLSCLFTPHNAPSNGSYWGYGKNNNPSIPADMANLNLRLGIGSGLDIAFYDGAATGYIGTMTQDAQSELRIILRSTGCFFVTKGGTHGTLAYTFLYPINAGADATLYTTFQNNNIIADIDDWIVFDYTFPGLWGSDYGIATARSATPSANAELATLCDFVGEFTWTPGAGDTLNIYFMYQDANNCGIIRASQAGSTIKIIQKVLGTETEKSSVAQTFTASTPYRIVFYKDYQSMRTFVNNSLKNNISNYTHNTGYRKIRTDTAGVDFVSYPRKMTEGGQGVELFSFGRNWTINAAAALTTPTYDTSGQAVHPDVYDAGVGNTWNGHRYWMALSPFPSANSAYENPSILVSADGLTWAEPVGITNPIIAKPGLDYNADPDITVDGVTMYCLNKLTSSPNDTIQIIQSTDGITWTAPATLFTCTHNAVISPAVVKVGSTFYMFSTDQTGTYKLTRRSASAMTGPWSDPVDCTMTLPGTRKPNHIDVISADERLYAFVMTDNYDACMAYSNDGGLTWTGTTAVTLAPSAAAWDSVGIYRGTIVRTASGFDLWYSAWTGAAPQVWHIGYTPIGF